MICEHIILGANTPYPLKGMLTLPDDTSAPLPAVVFVHGSGSSNMDEKVGRLTPFRDLAEGLAAHGIASLRYDKRTFAHPLKAIREKDMTVRQETIEDAVLAADLLRRDSRIDPANVFILGHSMGAMLAPRIDSEGGNFKGLILLAGTPRKLEEVLKGQLNEMLTEMKGFSRKIAEKQFTKILKMFDGLYEISDDEAKKKKFGGGVTMYYFKEMGEHPVEMYTDSLRKPMLILQGEKDFQVKPDVDFVRYKELLGDRDTVRYRLYENLNHVFVPSVYGMISKAKQEYNVEAHIGAEVIGDIAAWIREVL